VYRIFFGNFENGHGAAARRTTLRQVDLPPIIFGFLRWGGTLFFKKIDTKKHKSFCVAHVPLHDLCAFRSLLFTTVERSVNLPTLLKLQVHRTVQ
jgi:hypothetical protein